MAKPTESKRVTSSRVVRPGAVPARTCQSSVTGKSSPNCWISPSTRVWGGYSTKTEARGDDVAVELGLARAVAADGVEVHAGLDHLGRQDFRAGLVGGAGGDDVGAADGVGGRGGADDAEAGAGEVGAELVDGLGVGVEDADFLDAEERLERERLELGLRAGADHAP